MSEEVFVSISRASQLLGVSERTVRRAAGHLPDTDRQKRQGSPALVRLSALALQMGRADLVEGSPDMPDMDAGLAGQKKAAVPDTEEDIAGLAGHSGAAPKLQSQDALIEQLRSEVTFLRSALEREQSTAQALASRLEDSDKRLAAVLAGTGRLQINPPGLADGSHSSPEGSGGTIPLPESQEEQKTGFWSRLFGGVKSGR